MRSHHVVDANAMHTLQSRMRIDTDRLAHKPIHVTVYVRFEECKWTFVFT